MSDPRPPRAKRKAAPAKRAYLSRDLRRRALLDVAAVIVEREGWPALSMSALAEQGGTSRQLVYQHFPSLEKLLASTAAHIFNDAMRDTQASIEANTGSLMEAVRSAEVFTLDMPEGRGDALWQMIAGTAAASPEFEKIRYRIRDTITGVWTPLMRKQFGLSPADGKAYAWMSVMAFWGMRQLVRDGLIPRARGMRLVNDFLAQLIRT